MFEIVATWLEQLSILLVFLKFESKLIEYLAILSLDSKKYNFIATLNLIFGNSDIKSRLNPKMGLLIEMCSTEVDEHSCSTTPSKSILNKNKTQTPKMNLFLGGYLKADPKQIIEYAFLCDPWNSLKGITTSTNAVAIPSDI